LSGQFFVRLLLHPAQEMRLQIPDMYQLLFEERQIEKRTL
jgi:hypothetical protein